MPSLWAPTVLPVLAGEPMIEREPVAEAKVGIVRF